MLILTLDAKCVCCCFLGGFTLYKRRVHISHMQTKLLLYLLCVNHILKRKQAFKCLGWPLLFVEFTSLWCSSSIRNIPANLCQIRAFNCRSILWLGVSVFPLPKLLGFEHFKALLSNF